MIQNKPMNYFKCYLCGHKEKGFVIAIDGYKILNCKICGLGFLDSNATENPSENIYSEIYWQEDHAVKDPKNVIPQYIPKVNFIKKFKRQGKLLDIGCGLGYFLATAKNEGFSVLGIESSPWALDYIKKQFDIQIYPGPVENVEIDNNSIDICTMWQVIEHLKDPMQTLGKIRTLLKNEGVLILETRNYKGFDARVLKEKWNGWSLPYHLWHFDPHSFSRMIEKSGYKIIKIKLNHSMYVKNIIRKIPVIKLLRNPISSFFSGSNIRIIAKKV